MVPLSYTGFRGLPSKKYPSWSGVQVRGGSQPLSGLGFNPLWYPTRNLHARAHGAGGVHGLGLAPQAKSLIVSAPSIASGILTAGGTSSIAAVAWGAMAIPIIGAVVAGVTIGLALLFNRKGPGQKIATTHIVDAVENGFTDPNTGNYHGGLKQNLIGYFQGPRTESSKLQALNNFDAGWSYVKSHCNVPEMGAPGQHCVEDRQSGACVWRREVGSEMTQYDGIQPGECFDWIKGYRTPIARDIPNPDPVLSSGEQQVINDTISTINATIESVTGSSGGLLLAGAGILLLAAMAGGSR